MLLVHVADRHLVHGAKPGGVVHDVAGIKRVDMNPDRRVIANDNQGLALLLQPGPDLVRVELLSLEHELGAVPEGYLVGGNHRVRPPGQRDTAGNHQWLAELHLFHLTPQVVEGAFEDGIQALPPGIDHARFLEDRKQSRGIGHRLVGGRDGGLKHLGQVRVAVFRRPLGGRGSILDHGEDGTFHRIAQALVGHPGGLLEGTGEVGPGQRLLAGDILSKAAQNLRQYHAAIAPGSHQGPFGECLRYRRAAVVRSAVGLLHAGVQGQQHVGPGVAIRYRENVQGINIGSALLQPGSGTGKHLSEVLPGDNTCRPHHPLSFQTPGRICPVCTQRAPSLDRREGRARVFVIGVPLC